MKRRVFTRAMGLSALAAHIIPSGLSAMISGVNLFSNVHVPLGVCIHSLRSRKLNTGELVDYAIENKLDSVLINTLPVFESLKTEDLLVLKEKAENGGVSINLGVGSISEASMSFSGNYGTSEQLLLEGIRVAAILGSPVVGCRIGSIDDRYIPGGIRVHMNEVIRLMTKLGDRARDAGVKFAFENHMGDLRSDELLEIIQTCGFDICGALFDPANALWAMEDPLKAMKRLGSSIICTSVRDVSIWASDEGAIFQATSIGEGLMDFKLFTRMLAQNSPGVPLQVETISNSPRAIPYLKPDFWKAFPELPVSEIVDFLKLVRQGSPIEISTPPEGVSQKEFDIKLQESELENSINYLREHCM